MSAKKTGPKTAEGRERSAMNSLKHGLTSNKMFVLENETPEKWARMLRLWTDKLQPRDEAEMQIVTEAVFARWRMQRVWTIETGLLDLEMDSQADEPADQFEPSMKASARHPPSKSSPTSPPRSSSSIAMKPATGAASKKRSPHCGPFAR